MGKLLHPLDGEACCLGRLGSARVSRLRAANRQLIVAWLYCANAVCVHLGKLPRIEAEDDMLDLSGREAETLKALQLQVGRETAISLVGRYDVEFCDLIAGCGARVPHVGFGSQLIAGAKGLG